MLGKGLESLIPQKGSGNPAGNSQAPQQRPVAQPEPRRQQEPVRQQQPAQPVQQARPAAPTHTAPNRPPVIFPDRSSVATPPAEVFSRRDHVSQSRPAQTTPVTPVMPVKKEAAPIIAAASKEIAKDTSRQNESIFHIEVDKITPNPSQPRRHFDDTALQDLASSIREYGFLQPLVVSRINKETPHGVEIEYQLIAGERRLLASKLLGLKVVPAIVRKIGLEREKLELAVIENLQRENLDAIETARAFQRLQEEFRMTQREIASKLGKSREVVANTVRLLDLPEYIQVAVSKGEISESNARYLLGVEDKSAQRELFEEVVRNKLTTRDVKERIQQVTHVEADPMAPRRGRPPKTETHLAPELKAMQESLSSDLGAPVEIQKNANNGRITITFYSEEELENILRRLGKENF